MVASRQAALTESTGVALRSLAEERSADSPPASTHCLLLSPRVLGQNHVGKLALDLDGPGVTL